MLYNIFTNLGEKFVISGVNFAFNGDKEIHDKMLIGDKFLVCAGFGALKSITPNDFYLGLLETILLMMIIKEN